MSGISTKNYSAGDVIHSSQPMVHVLTTENKGKNCDSCLAMNRSLKVCTKCTQMYYCDRKCQLRDWKYHKQECDIMAKKIRFIRLSFVNKDDNTQQDDDCSDLFMRLILLLNRKPSVAEKKYTLHNGHQQRCFNDLLSHEEEVKTDVTLQNYCVKVLELLESLQITMFDLNGLIRIFGQLITNIFSLRGQKLGSVSGVSVGVGLYIPLSVFNHSCLPNACFVNNGTNLEIRAMKPIKAGEEILITYIGLDLPRRQRQVLLMQIKFFECHCEKCDSDMDSKIDYEKLSQLNAEYRKLCAEEADKGLSKPYHTRRVELSEQILAIYEQCYPYHSPFYCSLMHSHCITLVSAMFAGVTTLATIKPFIQTTAQNYKITVGNNNDIYKQFSFIFQRFLTN